MFQATQGQRLNTISASPSSIRVGGGTVGLASTNLSVLTDCDCTHRSMCRSRNRFFQPCQINNPQRFQISKCKLPYPSYLLMVCSIHIGPRIGWTQKRFWPTVTQMTCAKAREKGMCVYGCTYPSRLALPRKTQLTLQVEKVQPFFKLLILHSRCVRNNGGIYKDPNIPRIKQKGRQTRRKHNLWQWAINSSWSVIFL